VLVKPDTVVRWHRAGFKIYWNWISQRGRRTGRPAVGAELRALIRKMATENGWGAPRIHGELKMLGLDISERTVSRDLRGLRRRPEARPSWLTFLRNHREVIAAMDLFVVCTVTFRLLYVLFVIRHGRRQILHLNVAEHPPAAWVVQQIREAFPYDTAPKHFIFDRDSIFCAEVVERHLLRLLREYVRYHHDDRTHLGLGKDTPARRAVEGRTSAGARVVALPRVGGLHHRYVWRAAA
jgi:putative transposase